MSSSKFHVRSFSVSASGVAQGGPAMRAGQEVRMATGRRATVERIEGDAVVLRYQDNGDRSRFSKDFVRSLMMAAGCTA